MKLIIAGSRAFDCYPLLRAVCDDIVAIASGQPIEVVSGGARGADALGEQWAAERGYPVRRFPADWAKHGKAAGYRRNVEMAEYAGPDGLLAAFWDGQSRGTKHMIDIARSRGMRVELTMFTPDPAVSGNQDRP